MASRGSSASGCWKSVTRAGEIERHPSHVIDLVPTFLDSAGVSYPVEDTVLLPLAGTSLLGLWDGNSKLGSRVLFFEHEGNRAVRDGKWKLVWINHVQRWELYNINEDRTETNDLASEFPEVVADLKNRWLDWARNNFVELQRVEQPEKGMPKIYYW